MIEVIINKILNAIKKEFNKYRLDFDIQYNSDLDMITQYSRAFDARAFFKQMDIELISNADLELLNKRSHNLMMYGYSPLRRVKDRLNNVSFEMAFNPNEDNSYIQTYDNSDLFKIIREYNNRSQDLIIRDMIVGEMDIKCKILSTSTKDINEMQFVYVSKLQRNKAINLKFNFGDLGEIDFEYNMNFEDIEDIGHIDFIRYGNLMNMTFSFSFSGAIFSSYTTKYPILKEIITEVKFI